MRARAGIPEAMAAASAFAAPLASLTTTRVTSATCLLYELRAPRVVARKGLIEVEDAGELVAGIGGLAHQQLEVHEREDNIADVRGGAHAPVLEDEAGHHAEALQGEVPAGERE